jgi:hypothetical protein
MGTLYQWAMKDYIFINLNDWAPEKQRVRRQKRTFWGLLGLFGDFWILWCGVYITINEFAWD